MQPGDAPRVSKANTRTSPHIWKTAQSVSPGNIPTPPLLCRRGPASLALRAPIHTEDNPCAHNAMQEHIHQKITPRASIHASRVRKVHTPVSRAVQHKATAWHVPPAHTPELWLLSVQVRVRNAGQENIQVRKATHMKLTVSCVLPASTPPTPRLLQRAHA